MGIWAIRDSLFEMPVGVPTKLGKAEAKNHYRGNTIFVKQSYGVPLQHFDEYDFSMANKMAFYLGHSLEYSTWSKVYSDKKSPYTDDRGSINDKGEYEPVTDYYYDDWFLNADKTRDSIRERVVTNKLFIQAQPWGRNAVVGTLNGGIGFDMNAYSQMGLDGYLSGEAERTTRTSWYLYGAAEGRFRVFRVGRSPQNTPTGYRARYRCRGACQIERLSAQSTHKSIDESISNAAAQLGGEARVEPLYSTHPLGYNDNDLRKALYPTGTSSWVCATH